MKAILILATICGTVTAQDRSIEALRRQVSQGYHQVDSRTQTQARSGEPEAQARFRYQQAQSQATGDYNTGRITAADGEYARQRAAMAYQTKLLCIQQQRQLEDLRRQTEEIRRLRMAVEQLNAYRR